MVSPCLLAGLVANRAGDRQDQERVAQHWRAHGRSALASSCSGAEPDFQERCGRLFPALRLLGSIAYGSSFLLFAIIAGGAVPARAAVSRPYYSDAIATA